MSSRRFKLIRTEDPTGISGTGTVAEGCEFDNGCVAMTWLTPHWTGTWFMSVHEVKRLHSHGGKTKLVWIDEPNHDEKEEIE